MALSQAVDEHIEKSQDAQTDFITGKKDPAMGPGKYQGT